MNKYQREKINKKYIKKFNRVTCVFFFTHLKYHNYIKSELSKSIKVLHANFGKFWTKEKFESYLKSIREVKISIKNDKKLKRLSRHKKSK